MPHTDAVTQTVILAAGSGSRLGSGALGVPKPLLLIGGVPLVAHALEHARASGCTEAIVVIGHEGARVRAAVEAMPSPLRVRFVENADTASPNGVSLLAAEPAAAPRFFLQMVDHLFAECALPKLVAAALGAREVGRVLVDRLPVNLDLSDATKVRLEGGRRAGAIALVSAIGKGLDPWDAVDAGCFVLTRGVFDALRRAPAHEPRTVSSGMRQLVADGALGAADIEGIQWIDVDTPGDRDAAEELVQKQLIAKAR